MSEVFVSTARKRVTIRFKQEGVTAEAVPMAVRLNQPRLRVVTTRPRGLPGVSGSPDVTKIAVQNLGGHRVVYSVSKTEVDYADNTTTAHKHLILGITTGAASEGENVTVKTSGEMVENSWNWTPGGQIFCGASGLLTQTPPATGFLCVVGVATATDTIQIHIRQSLVLT